MSSHYLDFSSCRIVLGFCKSGHIYSSHSIGPFNRSSIISTQLIYYESAQISCSTFATVFLHIHAHGSFVVNQMSICYTK